MMEIRMALKKSMAMAFHYAGMLRGVRGLPIVTYHRVTDVSRHSDPLCVHTEVFELQMRQLAAERDVLGGEDLLAVLNGERTLPPRACVITFDDGWEDTYTRAYPILKRYALPAIVFVTSGFVGTKRVFWHERLAAALLRLPHDPEGRMPPASLAPPHVSRSMLQIAAQPAQRRRDAIERLVAELKRKTADQIEEAVQAVEGVCPPAMANELAGMLSWDQVRTMAEGGIVIGSHTRSHQLLPLLSPEQKAVELAGARADIEAEVGRPVRLVAYPNGDFDGAVLEAARAAGYAVGFTCRPSVNRTTANPLALERITMHDDSSAGPAGGFSRRGFRAELSGARIDARRWLMPWRAG